MRRGIVAAVLAIASLAASGQGQTDINAVITGGETRAKIAVPDFRGAGAAQNWMSAFNATLWSELAGSGALRMVEKSYYPVNVPQQPSDFKSASGALSGAGASPSGTSTLKDWSNPPASATHLAFGYAAVQNDQLAIRGYLFNLGVPDPAGAQLIAKLYFGPLSADGAKKTAREFAADILAAFGVKGLEGTKIYFVSDRTGHKEIWSMDHDGSNQRQLTRQANITQSPAISLDGKWLAYTTLFKRPGSPIESWNIIIQSTATGEKAHFANPDAPTNGWPDFGPNGRFLFASSLTRSTEIYSSTIEGGDVRQLTHSRSIDFSPRVNPKTGSDVVFISDRSGKQQLWHMNIDGGNTEMLTDGRGEVANPAWRSDGQMIAFAWTQGFELGGFNIFMMDVANRKPIQLTKDSGVNENPWWAPDNLHIVYSSKRGNSRSNATQIYTMTADGQNVRKLTSEGNNMQPVWVSGGQ
jgi:TolB protein